MCLQLQTLEAGSPTQYCEVDAHLSITMAGGQQGLLLLSSGIASSGCQIPSKFDDPEDDKADPAGESTLPGSEPWLLKSVLIPMQPRALQLEKHCTHASH